MQQDELITPLQVLCDSKTLSDRTQKTAERLLHRLSSPIRIDVLGPDESKNELFRVGLAAQKIPDAAVMIEPVSSADAFRNADICIWCTTDFCETEARAWAGAPDLLKDHSFLVPFTVIGGSNSSGSDTWTEELWGAASQEFHSLIPVTLHGADSEPDAPSLTPLAAKISNLVASGRRADRDHAVRILRNNRVEKTALVKSVDQHLKISGPTGEVKPVQPKPASLPVNGPAADIYEAALEAISQQAAKLVCPDEAEDKEGIDRVLAVCHGILDALVDLFSTAPAAGADFGGLQDEILCASDKLLLMRTEGTIEAAITAVTNVLQTRRDLKARLLN